MTSKLRKDGDPLGVLQNTLGDIAQMARASQSMPFRIPVLAEDPPEEDATNMWVFPDGRLRFRYLNTAGTAYVYREIASVASTSTASATAPAAQPDAIITRQNSWPAIWSHSYRGSGAQRTDQGATHLYYGSSGDSFNGTNRSLIGFDYGAIATELTGSTVNWVHLQLNNVHAWYDSGVNIYFGIHNFNAKPGTWTGGGIPRQRIVNHKFGKPQYREVNMPLEFATSIRDGWGKGIAIEAPSSSREFYGYAAGVGSGYSVPTLVINYTK